MCWGSFLSSSNKHQDSPGAPAILYASQRPEDVASVMTSKASVPLRKSPDPKENNSSPLAACVCFSQVTNKRPASLHQWRWMLPQGSDSLHKNIARFSIGNISNYLNLALVFFGELTLVSFNFVACQGTASQNQPWIKLLEDKAACWASHAVSLPSPRPSPILV